MFRSRLASLCAATESVNGTQRCFSKFIVRLVQNVQRSILEKSKFEVNFDIAVPLEVNFNVLLNLNIYLFLICIEYRCKFLYGLSEEVKLLLRSRLGVDFYSMKYISRLHMDQAKMRILIESS